MPLKTACLLLALFSSVCSVSIEIDLLNVGSTDNCHKYTEKGAEHLTLTHARLLEYDPKTGVIIGNTVCGFKYNQKSPPGAKNNFKSTCHSTGTTQLQNFVVMIGVTAQKEMLLSQVDYRFNKKLIGMNVLDVEKMKTKNFEHNQHIQIKRIKIEAKNAKEIKFASCHEIYPSSLIGDHGLYAMKWDESKKGKIGWNRMYFDPAGLEEILVI